MPSITERTVLLVNESWQDLSVVSVSYTHLDVYKRQVYTMLYGRVFRASLRAIVSYREDDKNQRMVGTALSPVEMGRRLHSVHGRVAYDRTNLFEFH